VRSATKLRKPPPVFRALFNPSRKSWGGPYGQCARIPSRCRPTDAANFVNSLVHGKRQKAKMEDLVIRESLRRVKRLRLNQTSSRIRNFVIG